MTNLSHEQAREFVQQDHLTEDDRLALRQHLMDCDDCRAFAATHVYLMQNLPLRAPSARPTTTQRDAILATAGKRVMPRIWRPVSAVGSLAAVMFLALAFWVILSAARPTASQPELPAPLGTLLAPVLPQPTPDPRGRYVLDTVPAPSLAGNVIGEPLEQQVAVYLPPSYDTGNRRYPVVYALIDDFEVYSNQSETHHRNTRFGMNQALAKGAQEMIVVTPNYVNALSLHNLFVNSPISGDWESYIAKDLVDYIDAHYRTRPAADSRGLLGEEKNGLSTLTIAMRHTGTFGAVYLQRPMIFHPGALEETNMVSPAGRVGVLNLFDELSPLSPDEALTTLKEWFTPGNTYSMSQFGATIYGIAFAPAAEAGVPYFEYPYTTVDGPPDPEIWRKWESGFGDIPAKLQPYQDALMALTITVSSGDAPGEGATYLSEQLTAAGVPHAFSQLEISVLEELGKDVFPFFSEVLAFD